MVLAIDTRSGKVNKRQVEVLMNMTFSSNKGYIERVKSGSLIPEDVLPISVCRSKVNSKLIRLLVEDQYVANDEEDDTAEETITVIDSNEVGALIKKYCDQYEGGIGLTIGDIQNGILKDLNKILKQAKV